MLRGHTHGRKAAALAIVLAALAGACGSDDNDSSSSQPEATTAPAATDTPATASSDTTGGGSAATTPEVTEPAGTDVPTTTGEPKESLKIGVILDQSGPSAGSQADNLVGIQLAVDQVNAAGGAGGHPLELVVADDASDSAKSVSQAIKLVEEDHVAAILGPMLSGGALAVIKQMNTSDAHVPMIGTAGDPSILHGDEETKKWYFNASLDTQLFAVDAVDVLNDQEHPASAGAIFTKVVSAESAADISKQHAEDLGIKWVGSEGVDLEQTDLLAAARNLKDAGAESVVVWAVTPAAVLGWLRAREQLSWDVPWVISDVTLSAHYESVPDLIEGALVGAFCDPRSEGFIKMLADYKAANGEDLKVGAYDNTGSMYNATLLLADAISRATDPADPASLRDAIESTTGFPSSCQIPDKIDLSAEDHVIAGGYPFFRFTGGEKVYL